MTTPNTGAGAQATTDAAAAASGAAASGTPNAGAGDAAAAGAAATAGNAAAATGAAADAAAAAAAGSNTGKPDGAAAAEPPKAPDKYELTLPEGGLLDQSDLDSIAEMAKSKAWTNEQAQAALTDYANSLKAQGDRFLTETTAHPEIGGDKLAAAQLHARAALDKFLPAESPEGKALRSAMDKSGYGNYAPMVLLLSRIGKAISEDRGIQPDTSKAPKARDAASVLYGGS